MQRPAPAGRFFFLRPAFPHGNLAHRRVRAAALSRTVMNNPPDPAPPPAVLVTWRMRALALLSGVTYALANPFVWPGDADGVTAALHRPAYLLAFVCLVPVLWAVRNMAPRQTYFFSAWFFVPGTFLLLYWLIIAMNVFGRIPLAVSILLLVLLSFVGWNFMGMAMGVARTLELRWKWPAVLATPVAWTGMEMWRAYIYFGGFPWGNLGTSQWNNTVVVQLSSLGGVYAILSFLTLINAVVVETLRWRAGERTRPVRPWLAAAGITVAVLLYGAWEMNRVEAAMAAAPKVRVGLIQGNIEQGIVNTQAQHKDFILDKYAALQKEALAQGAQVIVWPEGAFPGHFPKTLDSLSGRGFPPISPAVGVIGAGIYWREPPAQTGPECQARPMPAGCRESAYQHNSALVVDGYERITGRFDKTHLVPFGEYVPWPLGLVARAIVPGIATYVPGANLDALPLALDGSPRVGVLICYEGVFPQYARRFTSGGAQLLINVTNDAWYGISSASVQHLAFYSVRAAENARSVARAANTGVTASVDALGRVVRSSAIYSDAALVDDFPLMDIQTPYSLTGDVWGWLNGAVFFVGLFSGLRLSWLARREKRAQRVARV